jgi:hypothetical protein
VMAFFFSGRLKPTRNTAPSCATVICSFITLFLIAGSSWN